MEEKRILLQFYPYSSQIDSSFWHTLCRVKLEKLRLSEKPIDISATTRLELNPTLPSLVKIDYESFGPSGLVNDNCASELCSGSLCEQQLLYGKLIIYNTFDQFNNSDKRQLIIDSAKFIWESIVDESLRQKVDSKLDNYLSRLFVIVYADLKQYCFHYWCAFPAINFPPKCFQLSKTESLKDYFTTNQLIELLTRYTELGIDDCRYFVILLKDGSSSSEEGGGKDNQPESSLPDSPRVSIQPFSQFWLQENIVSLEQSNRNYRLYFAFNDPSPNCKYPGWPLRNYLAYLYCRFGQLLRSERIQKFPENSERLALIENFMKKHLFNPSLNILSFRIYHHLLREFVAKSSEDGATSSIIIDQQQRQSKLESIVDQFNQQSLIFRIVFGTGKVGYQSNNESSSISGSDSADSEVVDSCQSIQSNSDGATFASGICLDSFLSHVFNTGQLKDCVLDSNDNAAIYRPLPPIVGWERNPQKLNKFVSRFVDLKHQLDPKVIASDAVHLNLKLMKWRLLPRMDLQLFTDTRCLLLGAGTLGCNISRLLMAWGIGNITFVDSAKVSYSNPVRQTLFKFADCNPSPSGGDNDNKDNNRNRMKAETAAEALREIYPGIAARGVSLSIPMPGHSVPDFAIGSIRKDVETLEQLIGEHDVVFLLTDTRESRWLPTVISASMHKTVINVALGFDTFLVSRHGIRMREQNPVDSQSPLYPLFMEQSKFLLEIQKSDNGGGGSSQPGTSALSSRNVDTTFGNMLVGSNLGCYYCNDVVSPGDSTRDRTLDQQCTVARPGLSMVASGVAVELLASLIQHPAGPLAPSLLRTATNESLAVQQQSSVPSRSFATKHSETLDLESILGLIPHQVRGFISRFQNFAFCFPPFAQCCACSFTIIDKYRSEGFDFLHSIFNDSTLLEKISGLDRYQNSDISDIVSLEISSDEEEEGEEEEQEEKNSGFLEIVVC